MTIFGKSHAPEHRRQGYTLIEIAIVLGVMGSIVAGLFIVAEIAQYRVMTNRASDELNLIADNMRNFYVAQNVSVAALGVNCTINYSAAAVSQGLFPKEMVSGGFANNPWNDGVATNTAQVGLTSNIVACPTVQGPVQIVVEYTNIPAEACTDLVTRNSLSGRETGLQEIQVNAAVVGIAGNTGATPLPVDPITSKAHCTSATANTIDWFYNLHN